MLRKILHAFPLIALLSVASPLHADDRIDRILEELAALRQQVSQLEERLESVEAQPRVPTPAEAASEQPEEERQGWFDSMRLELKKAEVRASGPWTDPRSWNRVEKGMDKDAVVALLGEPTRFKFSVRKDTDEILIYEGDLDGSGEPVEGEVRIYKGSVRRFTAPDFPDQG